MKLYNIATTALLVSSTWAFVPSALRESRTSFLPRSVGIASETESTVKPTGTSFLPPETIERCKQGSPIEKAKLAKDGTASWVDVYEYARKIREGEMTWEDVEKNDLDTVSLSLI